jgi:hypothetical protein
VRIPRPEPRTRHDGHDTLTRNYAQSHWYGVSTTAEFKAAAQALTSTDLTSFWTQHRIDG